MTDAVLDIISFGNRSAMALHEYANIVYNICQLALGEAKRSLAGV